MAGSTESNKRMGEMVKTVSAHGCPKGYSGIPPNCKKIKEEADAIVTYDDETTKKTFKGKERRQQRRENRKERKREKKENKDK